MTIKQQGGIFGRNPTFNDLTVEGDLTSSGTITLGADSVSGDAIDGGTATPENISTSGTASFDTSVVANNSQGNNDFHVKSSGADYGIFHDASSTFTGFGTVPSNMIHMKYSGDYEVKFENASSNAYFQMRSSSSGVRLANYLGMGTNVTNGGFFFDLNGNGEVRWGRNNSVIMTIEANNNLNLRDGAGNITFASGSGIDFSSTSGTGTSELFDDYEEGTWTPTYAPSTGSFTSITYGNTGGVYTKIGNICIVSGYISTSALDTTGGSGAIKVGGLPYGIAGSSGGTRDAWRGGSIGYSAGWSGERPSSVFASGGASDFRIMYRSNATSDSSYVLVADMDTSGSNEIAFTLTYRV